LPSSPKARSFSLSPDRTYVQYLVTFKSSILVHTHPHPESPRRRQPARSSFTLLFRPPSSTFGPGRAILRFLHFDLFSAPCFLFSRPSKLLRSCHASASFSFSTLHALVHSFFDHKPCTFINFQTLWPKTGGYGRSSAKPPEIIGIRTHEIFRDGCPPNPFVFRMAPENTDVAVK
jgi:hypothetical protein